MTAVPPPLPQGAAPSAALPPAAEVVVPAAPPSPEVAAKLAALRQLEAVVKALDARTGTVLLDTPAGSLAVRLQVPVQAGTQLLLQVTGTARPGSAPPLRLVAVDGRPPLQALRGAVAQAAQMPPRAAGAPVLEPAAPPRGEAAPTATVLRAAPVVPGQPQPPAAGTVFTVRILSVEPPSPAGAAPASVAIPQLPAGAPAGVAAAAPAPSAPIPSAAPQAVAPGPAAPMAVPAQAPSAASQPIASALPAAPAPPAFETPRLSGVVAPNSHSGQPLVQTASGLVVLGGTPPLPPGARVVMEVVGQPQTPATPPVSTGTAPAPVQAGASGFAGLAQGIEVLRQADPAAAARLTGMLPQVGPRLAEGMVAFAAALRTEALAAVAESAAKGLDRIGRREVARRLVQELGDAMPQARATPQGEWRVATMPLLHGGVVEPVRLWLRRPEWDDEDAERRGPEGGPGGGQRFVLDLTFSHFGRFQLDSLIQRRAKRFDVVIRTERPLPEEVTRDLADIFRRCCEGMGLAGQALFKAGEAFFEPADAAGATPCQGILA